MKTAEIVRLPCATKLLNSYDLAVAGRFSGSSNAPLILMAMVSSPKELQAQFAERSVPFRVCLSRAPFDLSAPSLNEFMLRNTTSCVVDIGELTRIA